MGAEIRVIQDPGPLVQGSFPLPEELCGSPGQYPPREDPDHVAHQPE